MEPDEEVITIPELEKLGKEVSAMMLRFHRKGAGLQEVAEYFECSIATVQRRIAALRGYKARKGGRPPGALNEKTMVNLRKALKLRDEGLTYPKIGKQLGMTGPGAFALIKRNHKHVPTKKP